MEDPLTANFPSGQFSHILDPSVNENVLIWQIEQLDALPFEIKPAGHIIYFSDPILGL